MRVVRLSLCAPVLACGIAWGGESTHGWWSQVLATFAEGYAVARWDTSEEYTWGLWKIGSDGNREPAAYISGVSLDLYRFELMGGALFWIWQPEKLEGDWKHEVRAIDLRTKRETTIHSARGIYYSASHSGRFVMVDDGMRKREVLMVDRETGRKEKLFDGIDTRIWGWSMDDRYAWFAGEKKEEGWSLYLWRDGSLEQFDVLVPDERALNRGNGWIAYPTSPDFFHADFDYYRFIMSGSRTALYVIDVLNSKRVKIDTAIGETLRASWTSDNRLVYGKEGQTFVVDPAPLLKKSPKVKKLLP